MTDLAGWWVTVFSPPKWQSDFSDPLGSLRNGMRLTLGKEAREGHWLLLPEVSHHELVTGAPSYLCICLRPSCHCPETRSKPFLQRLLSRHYHVFFCNCKFCCDWVLCESFPRISVHLIFSSMYPPPMSKEWDCTFRSTPNPWSDCIFPIFILVFGQAGLTAHTRLRGGWGYHSLPCCCC